jgi:hypothetical protein
MSKTVQHGVYTIKSAPFPQPTTNTWTLAIVISWESDGIMNLRPFSPDGPTYSTEEEADLHGIAFGELISDRKIPGL